VAAGARRGDLVVLLDDELPGVGDVGVGAERLDAERPADGLPADPWNAVLRVHASNSDEAQSAVESVLGESAKRWELTGITPGEHGFQQLEYVVRLKPSIARGSLLNSLRARGAPNVIGAEFR